MTKTISSESVSHWDKKKFRDGEKVIRRTLSKYVREIYRLWGMSDTRFCKYMGEELNMTEQGVRNFICNPKRLCMMDEGLLSKEKLLGILQKVFEKFVSDGRVDIGVRKEAEQQWGKQKKQYTEKITEACKLLSLIHCLENLENAAQSIEKIELYDEKIAKLETEKKKLNYLILAQYLTEECSRGSSQELSAEETEKFRVALKPVLSMTEITEEYISGLYRTLIGLLIQTFVSRARENNDE